MNKDVLASRIKKEFPELGGSQLNGFCVSLWTEIALFYKDRQALALSNAANGTKSKQAIVAAKHKQEINEIKSKQAAAAARHRQEIKSKQVSGGATISDKIQEFLDNPMTPEEETRSLRAVLHAGLATGEIPAPLLDKIDKIIGINSGEDEAIELVDFSKAFPNLAASVDVCSAPALDRVTEWLDGLGKAVVGKTKGSA
jgi:hypothetical protein